MTKSRPHRTAAVPSPAEEAVLHQQFTRRLGDDPRFLRDIRRGLRDAREGRVVDVEELRRLAKAK